MRIQGRSKCCLGVIIALTCVLTACGGSSGRQPAPTTSATAPAALQPTPAPGTTTASGDIHKIKHVVVIMQENRSFDSYFGTYPGADGIPMQNGQPSVCVPDATSGRCVAPFYDPQHLNSGGTHGQNKATA